MGDADRRRGADAPSPAKAAAWFAPRLLAWFDLHGRKHLPWQQDPSGYRVWVSEVMLQQTQVAAVVPYFERFLQRFPDVRSLAEAPPDEVLHLWTGLGYYARARNLQAAARILVAEHGGEFPAALDAVMALPGIGRSTAGAILSLARGERHAILDGNVKRVLARVFGIAGDPGSAPVLAQLWRLAEELTPRTRVAAYTQAIMDLGATVCTRSRPACTTCPMSTDCVAAREGLQRELPGRKPPRARKSRAAVLLIAESRLNGERAVLVERRPPTGIWGGLWSPPQFANHGEAQAWIARELQDVESVEPALPVIFHAFTHFDLQLQPLRVRCRAVTGTGDAARLWYALQAPPRVGLPQPIRQLFARLVADA